MRRLAIIILLLIALPVQTMAGKRAYLVCIGDYPPEKGWAQISSGNDLSILSSALSEDFVVESISDSLATYGNVVSFLNSITSKVSPSDTVLIHFSCHGQQMNLNVDDSDLGIDGLDEALVMYDAEKEYSQNYGGECHLRDNEMGTITEKIRYVLGEKGLLVVSFDACHSDSMFKGDDEEPVINGSKIRGYAGIFGPEPDSLTLEKLRSMHFAQDTIAVVRMEGQSDAIFISACQAADRNRETVQNGTGYGSLSYAFARAYQDVDGFRDMGGFISSILAEMKALHPYQKPVVRSSYPVVAETLGHEDGQSTGIPLWRKCILIAGFMAIMACAVLWIIRRRK